MTQPPNHSAITQATLDELDAERRDAAAEQHDRAHSDVHEAWVTFRVAGHWLAVDATHVEEIADLQPPLPIPRAPAHIPGLLNVRGHAVPLLDLQAFLNLTPTTQEMERAAEERGHGRVILIQWNVMRVGLLCAQVRSLEHVPETLLQTPAGLNGLKVGTFAIAQADMGTGVVTLLYLPKLVEAALFT